MLYRYLSTTLLLFIVAFFAPFVIFPIGFVLIYLIAGVMTILYALGLLALPGLVCLSISAARRRKSSIGRYVAASALYSSLGSLPAAYLLFRMAGRPLSGKVVSCGYYLLYGGWLAGIIALPASASAFSGILLELAGGTFYIAAVTFSVVNVIAFLSSLFLFVTWYENNREGWPNNAPPDTFPDRRYLIPFIAAAPGHWVWLVLHLYRATEVYLLRA